MTKSQAKGYLLEIVLSKLLEINGYDVITVPDGNEIILKHNGLNIKGRGGFHQFDTLGKFKITPPFMSPLRLFVEAKFYDSKVGIDKVRMGVGILEDININYSTIDMTEKELAKERYQYQYAIFSTSGFTKNAQSFAIAHKVHLIDLTGNEYNKIKDLITDIVEEFFELNNIKIDFSLFKEQFFKIIRGEIECIEIKKIFNVEEKKILDLKDYIENHFLYIATINNRYLIALLSNLCFYKLLKKNPHQNIKIKNEEKSINKLTIALKSMTNIKIEFTLPDLCHNLILDIKHNEKKIILAFIAYFNKINPTFCTLTL